MDNFTNTEYIILCVLLGYGIVLGFKNTFFRVLGVLPFVTYTQDWEGKLLDVVFYTGIVYLVLVSQGVIL